MKKLVTIFFLFIMSIQCLPLKELGKCLFDQAFTEEQAAKKMTTEKADDELKLFFENLSSPSFVILKANHFPRLRTSLHNAYTADVTTPPPNV